MANVPEFGNWENEGDIPYTQYFENARKGKGRGKVTNPNDPNENPSFFSNDVRPVQAPPFRTKSDPDTSRMTKDGRRTSREHGNLPRTPTDSPARYEGMARKPRVSDTQRRPDRSSENSPIHPHMQAKIAGKVGPGSPSWERRGSSTPGHGFAPHTPGRSRMKPSGRGDEILEKGSAVPKFGEWHESNPSSADGYTHIFERVREEKQSGMAKVPNVPPKHVSSEGGKSRSLEASKCSCCPWFRK